MNLIKIDRNGSKHYEGIVECDRCQGRGWFATGVCNGELVPSHVDNAVCWKCHGSGKVKMKWIERTPEYQAKLDAKREAKAAAEREKLKAEEAEREKARKAEEERIAKEEALERARRAVSQYVGEIGERLSVECCFQYSAWYEVSDPFGRPSTRYIHSFKDVNGNVLIWRTSCWLDLHEGEPVLLTGTVKEHSEYKEQKQTSLLRCKVKPLFERKDDPIPEQKYEGSAQEGIDLFWKCVES